MASVSELLSAPSGSARWAQWRRRALEIGRRLRRSRDGDAGPDCSRRSAYVYLALLVPALACIVLSNWKWNTVVNDTLLLMGSFEMLERFSSLFSNANANPLQALFDIFPSGLRLDTIPNIIGRALLGPGMHVDFFYIFSGVLLAYAVAAMARAAGLRWGVSVLAGILLPLLLLPTFGPFPLADHFYLLWPAAYYSTAGAVFVTALFWRIDGRWTRSVLLTAVIILMLVHLSMIQILFMTLLAPAIAAMGIGALAASRSRSELVNKIVCAGVIVAALAGAGIFHYLYALGINTATYVFYQELIDFMNFSSPSWSVILDDVGSVIRNPFSSQFAEKANIESVLVPMSQLGAVYLAIFGTTREARIFGRTVLIWVVATAFVIAVLHNFFYYTGRMYQGPDPRHLVSILWPYYVICLASLIFAAAQGGLALLSRAWPGARGLSSYVPHGLAILVLAAPVAFIGVNQMLRAVAPDQAFRATYFPSGLPFHSFQRNPVIDFLEREIGVALDSDFRGTVFAMPTEYDKDTKPYGIWRRETTFAYARAYLANDLGAFGLRYYNIPTIDEMTHNVTPQFYLTVRELLTRPGTDAYDRHFAVVTRLNEPIMALLGLRYLIADYELPVGSQRLAWPIPDEARKALESQRLLKSPLRIYELPHPNLGNYSPTEVVRAETAKDAIVAMSTPGFDGRQTLVTDDASIGDNLVPATGATMTVRMGGVALKASSSGQSVLVLPVQYSHCWRIVSGSDASLFRANLMQLGVRFSGELRLELRQFFGPFWQSSCRLADAADIKRLRMVGAVGAGAERHKIPGDGINAIPSPEALDTVIGSSEIASFKAVAAPNAPAREYKITAQGKFGDHYSVLPVSKLSPGAYTLSMQVRADSAPRMALQINDGANGALAEYVLPMRAARVHRLGQGDKLSATIREIDDEWLQLTVTSTVSAERGNVFIHVPDSRITAAFKPGGEAATIRAVKLERGETATPYPGFDQQGAFAGLPRRPKAPGDGVNVIPNPEALDAVIGSSQIASFEPLGTAGARVKEYKLTAIGGPTEHFVGIGELPVRAGAYTLSMQVNPKGTARLRLQLLDAGGKGTIADYDLAAPGAAMTHLAKSDAMDAGIRRLSKDWLELRLTASLESGMARVLVQLLGADGSNGFAPKGEAVVLRAIKLERGETATPYAGLGQ